MEQKLSYILGFQPREKAAGWLRLTSNPRISADKDSGNSYVSSIYYPGCYPTKRQNQGPLRCSLDCYAGNSEPSSMHQPRAHAAGTLGV